MIQRTDVSTLRFPICRRLSSRLVAFTLLLIFGGTLEVSAQAGEAESGADRIYPGDVIKLDVWREEELSGQFTVDRLGIVVLPMVGRYDVAGETPESFEARVVEAMQREIENPSIDVTVLRRVRVTGFVRAGGVFALDPTMSVADALAMAGGLAEDGVPDLILLFRSGAVVPSNLSPSASVYESAIRSGDELRVPQLGWFSRNTASVITGTSAVLGIIVTLIATSGN